MPYPRSVRVHIVQDELVHSTAFAVVGYPELAVEYKPVAESLMVVVVGYQGVDPEVNAGEG